MDLFKYLDPSTLNDSSFLSFSSFAEITQSPYDDQGLGHFNNLNTAGHGTEKNLSYPTCSPTPPRSFSESGSESPENPFRIIHSAFSPSTPSSSGGDFGIFHTPSTAGPSKLSGPNPTVNPSLHVSHRSTSSSDWNSPVTPSLTYKSSVDSLATLAPEQEFYLPPTTHSAYGWDDQSLGSSSSLTPLKHSPPSPSPYRVASNPTLGAYRHPRVIKQITSMPALKEEEQSAPAFDFNDYVNDGSETAPDQGLGNLTGDFGYAFPELGQDSIFQSFANDNSDAVFNFDNNAQSNVASSSSSEYQSQPSLPQGEAPTLVPDLSFSSVDNEQFNPSSYDWLNESTSLQSAPSTSYGGQQSGSSVDPMAVFQSDPRPATAPDGLGIWSDESYLGVPGPGSMLRSVSSDAVLPSRQDNFRNPFAYNAQNVAGPSMPQHMYAHPPSQSFQTYSSGMPLQSFMGRRHMSQPLSINVPHHYYQQQRLHPDHMTLTPMSAPYLGSLGYTSVKPTAPPMKRVGSQPISGAKAGRRSFSGGSYDRDEEEVPARRIPMEEASVMQPLPPPRRESMPTVWVHPMHAGQMHGGPMYHYPINSSALTTAPLVNVHPPMHQQRTPPMGYYSAPPQPHPSTHQLGHPNKIHPPPHPGSSSASASNDVEAGARPMARLPSAASKRPRQASSTTGTPTRTPKTRTSPGRKRNVPSGGTFSWGDTTFINFTADDGEKLLTGVAPSGSQSKRKREEEQAHANLLAVATALTRQGSSEGSDCSDDNRSKRSKSGGE